MNEQAIDIRDISVGSYVFVPFLDEKVGRVSGYYGADNLECVSIIDDSGYTGIAKLLKPIPVSAEWLIKFGFCFNEQADRYDLHAEPTDEEDETLLITVSFAGVEGEVLVRGGEEGHIFLYAKSIHKLQAIVWLIERIWLTLDRKEVSA